MAQNNEDNMVNKDQTAGAATPSGEGGASSARTETRRVVRKVVKPVKKKKVIIVTGDGSGSGNRSQQRSGGGSYSSAGRNGTSESGTRRQRPASGAGTGSARSGGNASSGAGAYHPIKPKTAPSVMSGDYHKPIPKSEQPVRAQDVPPAEDLREQAPQVEEPIGNLQEDTAQAARESEILKTQPAASGESADAAEKEMAELPVTPKQEGPAALDQSQETAPSPAAPTLSVSSAEEDVRELSDADSDAVSRSQSTAQREESERSQGGTARTDRQGSYENRGQGRSYGQGQGGSARTDRQGSYENRGQGRSYGQSQGRTARTDRQGGYENRGQGRGYGQGQGGTTRTDRQGGYENRAQGRSYGQGQGGTARTDRQGSYENRGQGRSYGQNSQGRSYGQGGSGRSAGQGSRGASSGGGQNFSENGQNRRRNQQSGAAKDRRRKDAAFEQTEQRERRNRSGRFIRPVVEQVQEPEEQIKVITIPEKLTIGALAEAMHLKPAELIKKLFLAGKAMTVNSEVTYEEAENIAADYEILCEKEEKVDVIEELLKEDADPEETLIPRPPVICVMGHVDHGKTSILDYIRKTRVTEKEAGGITQAIGAYTVAVQDRMITFLDTPGHEAFTAMRLRGAKSTDIAVLVIAADDGVMPQTIEAINHARAAQVEIIVALNKIDKPDADPEKVKQQLTKYNLVPTDWGGSTEFVEVSAKTGQGIEDLLDTILLQADVMELRANPNRLARGLVLEARLDRGRGPVANVLVQKGTLHVGDYISAGPAFGRVRALIDDKGQNVKEAGPSEPVMVLGLSEVPSAGEVIVAHPSNDEAKSYAQTYKAQHKEELVEENVMSMNVEDLFDQMREGKMKELGLIVKADVQGSVEALCASLLKLSNEEVRVRIIHSAAGAITESDVDLAAASNAAIIGFNVAPNAIAKSNAEHSGVSIHLYKVIYQAIDEVDAALKGMLAPVYEEKITGHAEVRQIFKSGKIGNIAGCMVLDGVIEKDALVRITREKDQIFEGDLASLKRFKDDVKEVKAGYDCGMVFKDFDAIAEGDQIEAYKMVEVPREEVIARKEREAAKKEREGAKA